MGSTVSTALGSESSPPDSKSNLPANIPVIHVTEPSAPIFDPEFPDLVQLSLQEDDCHLRGSPGDRPQSSSSSSSSDDSPDEAPPRLAPRRPRIFPGNIKRSRSTRMPNRQVLKDPLGNQFPHELHQFASRIEFEEYWGDDLMWAILPKASSSGMDSNSCEKIQIASKAHGGKVKKISLMRAASLQTDDAVRNALELGFDVNTLLSAEGNLCTLLHIVTMQPRLDFMVWLLDRNADVNAPDSNGLTPLHYAVYQGHQPAVELLLLCSTNKPLLQMKSLLHLAIEKIKPEIIDCIVKHIALIESQGPYVDPDTYGFIDKHLDVRDYFNVCRLELDRIEEHFAENQISYQDFFDDDELNRLARDEFVIDVFGRCNLEEISPIYGKIFEARFERQKQKIEVEDQVIRVLSRIFGFDLKKRRKIRRRMINYLQTEELYSLSSC